MRIAIAAIVCCLTTTACTWSQTNGVGSASALAAASNRRLEHEAEIFDPTVNMLRGPNGTHGGRAAFNYAVDLIRRGGSEDLDRAAKVLDAAFKLQIRVSGGYQSGNFKQVLEQENVGDLNEVNFDLRTLAELMALPNFEKLSDKAKQQVREGVGAGLVELDHLDVPWDYTNIHIMQTGNLIVNGETLGPNYRYYVDKGYRMLEALLERSNSNGAVFEYNSPPYNGLDINLLAWIAGSAQRPAGKAMARLLEERIWVHAAMRMHPATKRQAGPWARARYANLRSGGGGATGSVMASVTGDREFTSGNYPSGAREGGGEGAGEEPGFPYDAPDWVRNLILKKPLPYYVQEITNRTIRDPREGSDDLGAPNDITTYLTDHYALGTSSRTYEEDYLNTEGYQSRLSKNTLLYKRDGVPGFGLLYPLYIINDVLPLDNTLDPRVTPDKVMDEKGLLRAVQYKNKAIVLYHPPRLSGDDYTSLRTAVTILDRSRVSEIRINEQQVTTLPMQLTSSDTLFLSDSGTYIALLPLEPTNIGYGPSIELQEDKEKNLVLSIYNYRGAPAMFAEYKARLPFFRGNMKNGFIIEVSSASEVGSFEQFRKQISAARVTDFTDGHSKTREVSYSSGSDQISIKVDLKSDALLERRINGEVYSPPFMVSTTAVSGDSGSLEVAGAKLLTDARQAWLLVDQVSGAYVAATPSTKDRGPIRLETPNGTLQSPLFGCGRVAYYPGENPRVDMLSAGENGPVCFSKPVGRATVSVNGEDVSSRLQSMRINRMDVLCLPARTN